MSIAVRRSRSRRLRGQGGPEGSAERTAVAVGDGSAAKPAAERKLDVVSRPEVPREPGLGPEPAEDNAGLPGARCTSASDDVRGRPSTRADLDAMIRDLARLAADLYFEGKLGKPRTESK